MKIAASAPAEMTKPARTDDFTAADASGANDFAFRFSSGLLKQAEPDKNFVCSPISAWLPLAALVNAADADARPALLKAVGEAGLSADELNAAASSLLWELTGGRRNEWRTGDGLEPHNPLSIADAIFVSDKETLREEFARVFAEYYGGTAIEVDFSSPEAADKVNAWADENTKGLIPKIVDSFDPQTSAAIANAIYFSDRWEWEFDEDETSSGVFHAPSGDEEAMFMLREGADLLYYEDDVAQAIRLDFVMGGSVTVLLPRRGDASGLLGSLTAERFGEIRDGMSARTGKLLLPRFRMESDVMTLSETLEAMDVPLFDPANLALTELVASQPLYISDAVQKASIKVDEKGTTAAAVTMMAMTGTALPAPTEPFEMICDRPFVFVLSGDGGLEEETVLFTGVVNLPEE